MRHFAQWLRVALAFALLYVVIIPLAIVLRVDPPRDWEEEN
jgi:hypothetical protein